MRAVRSLHESLSSGSLSSSSIRAYSEKEMDALAIIKLQDDILRNLESTSQAALLQRLEASMLHRSFENQKSLCERRRIVKDVVLAPAVLTTEVERGGAQQLLGEDTPSVVPPVPVEKLSLSRFTQKPLTPGTRDIWAAGGSARMKCVFRDNVKVEK